MFSLALHLVSVSLLVANAIIIIIIMFPFLNEVLLLPSSFGSVDSVQCAEGFMEYELLQKKANQIPNRVGALSNNKLPGGKTYVLPSLSFDCAGTITGFFIGVDIRTDNGRNEIPWVGLFNYNYYHYYTLVADSKRYFTLNAENFSTNGLIQYNFDQPLHFEGNQMLGVYQPDNNDSKVTLFHYDIKGQNVYEIEEHAHWPWFIPHFYKTAQLENSAILFRPIMTMSLVNEILLSCCTKYMHNYSLFTLTERICYKQNEFLVHEWACSL